MKHETLNSPLNVGDHIRYVSARTHTAPGGPEQEAELVLTPGMEGVILLSNRALSSEGPVAATPWHCLAQFENGYQIEITAENRADFEVVAPD